MTFEGQHLRFSVDLPFKGGHEAIVNNIESELKHLEHVKEYLNRRAKVELEYALALTRVNTTASKVITDSDKESPVRKVGLFNLVSFVSLVLLDIRRMLLNNMIAFVLTHRDMNRKLNYYQRNDVKSC